VFGFATAVALAGCSSGPPESGDAALPDGVVPTDGDSPDVTDSATARQHDAAATPDEAADRIPSDPTDLRVPDLVAEDAVGAPDLRPVERPSADGPAAEAPSADRPSPDTATDGPGPDVMAIDGAPAAATDAGCTGWTTLEHLAPADAKALIETSDPIVINVHYPYEGDIPGTDATIPFDDVDAIDAYLGYDHCADVLLVCKGGSMSASAGNALIKRGYLRVRDLKGGMTAWANAGYPLLQDGGV
jgi:rhodanese-related sulfurtransferase